MKFAICDDSSIIQTQISQLINEYIQLKKHNITIAFFSSGEELLASDINYDLIIMDYQLSGINGIETCKEIRKTNTTCKIIFLSAYTQTAIDTFDVDTFRFLAKPIDKEKFFKALDDFFEAMKKNYILLKTLKQTWKINLKDIIYAEADGKKTILRCLSESYTINYNLHELEKKLPTDQFIRCHRAFVVGFYHIKNHTSDEIMFDNGEKASIGQKYLKQFKEALQDYIIEYNH